jgi:hypothetical protein
MPALGAMERSLNGEDDQVVDEKYIGETVVSVKSHQRTDFQTVTLKFAFSCWLHCLALQNNQDGMDNEKFRLFTVDLGDALPVKPEGYTKHV